MKVIFLSLAAALLVGLVVTRGIHARTQASSDVRQQTLDLSIPAVSVIHPKPGAMQEEITLPGNIQAFSEAPIYARTNGYLKKWYADIGQPVKAGQVLAEIDAPEQDQQVAQAKSSLQQAQASLEQAIANRQQAKVNEDLARVTAGRWQNMADKGVVSRQENDQYQAQYQAQIAMGQSLEKAIAAARSAISAMEANVATLEQLRSYRTVTAPFDGVITARNTDVGALINSGSGGSAQELFHISASSRVRIFVSVPEAISRAVVPGTAADLTLAEFPNKRFRGTVARTAESLDPATRTLQTEVDLDNPSGELRPGAYAEVHLSLPATKSLLLPVNSFLFRAEGQQVGVVRDGGQAQLVSVKTGKDYGNEIEVLSGISESDLVIANPPDSLTSGMSVRVISGDESKVR
jgi:RND family efflux transporter MFP subunit